MGKYKILNSPAVKNMPWQDAPAQLDKAQGWRYS